MREITIIGGGLAGTEAAWQAAQRGINVRLYEMRPVVRTEAHTTPFLAELVCSNSLGAKNIDRASGLLQAELRLLGSLLLRCAEQSALPAGNSLSVDREIFAQMVTQEIERHPNIKVSREEVTCITDTHTIIASGPLTSAKLSGEIQRITGRNRLFFYDAIAPIVTYESINMQKAFRASRYGKGTQPEGDYINCPLTREEYEYFVSRLITAERRKLAAFEGEIKRGVRAGSGEYFEGCLPIEILAERGVNSLAFGPMRPVGLRDPSTNKRPYAVVQLRQDNLAGTLYNLVGFQTNITHTAQKELFSLIPGLEKASFVRYGEMHRNTYIASPVLLLPSLQLKNHPSLFFAGQITGVEGYLGNIASGLVAGVNLSRMVTEREILEFPAQTMIGALLQYITHAEEEKFQPMKANLGLLPALQDPVRDKQSRYLRYAERSLEELRSFVNAYQVLE